MNRGYYNQPPYPGVAFPQLQPPAPMPDKPARPWPLAAVNRWMTISLAVITLLSVLLAVLASRIVTPPPSTAGMTLAYQSSLTGNDGSLRWDENSTCQFFSDGYVVSAPDSEPGIRCRLLDSDFRNFTLSVHIVLANETAVIGFLGDLRLEISAAGRFRVYRGLPPPSLSDALYPSTGLTVGSAALHNSTLGLSDRENDIVIQVQGLSYSFYANGQLLTTYQATTGEDSGLVWLGTNAGQQAEFSNIAISTPG